jgi:hypothetical protein
MTKVRISKLDAAGRELAFSVKHFLAGDDPLPILTVVHATYSVLRDLLEESSGIRMTFDKLLHTSDKLGRDFKHVPEALRHADWHPEDIPPTDFYKLAYFTLACAILLWKAHDRPETADMRSFWNLRNPLKANRKAIVTLQYVEQYSPSRAPLSDVEKAALEVAVVRESS